MEVNLTPQDLIAFEEEVCTRFANKEILSPIHLDNANEEQLITIFREFVNEEDWVLGSWRQHYRALLKGVPRDQMMQAILEGKSISLCFPEYKVISSAIVGGILPIAVGIAMGIKRSGGTNKAVCFLGDMTSETGIFHECLKYSQNHDLPVLWVVECNHKSVCTPTLETWKAQDYTYRGEEPVGGGVFRHSGKVLWYEYESKYPHAGPGGQRIQF